MGTLARALPLLLLVSSLALAAVPDDPDDCKMWVMKVKKMKHKGAFVRVVDIKLIAPSKAVETEDLRACHALCDEVGCPAFAFYYIALTCSLAEGYEEDRNASRILTPEAVQADKELGFYVRDRKDRESMPFCFADRDTYGRYLQEKVRPWLFTETVTSPMTPALPLATSSATAHPTTGSSSAATPSASSTLTTIDSKTDSTSTPTSTTTAMGTPTVPTTTTTSPASTPSSSSSSTSQMTSTSGKPEPTSTTTVTTTPSKKTETSSTSTTSVPTSTASSSSTTTTGASSPSTITTSKTTGTPSTTTTSPSPTPSSSSSTSQTTSTSGKTEPTTTSKKDPKPDYVETDTACSIVVNGVRFYMNDGDNKTIGELAGNISYTAEVGVTVKNYFVMPDCRLNVCMMNGSLIVLTRPEESVNVFEDAPLPVENVKNATCTCGPLETTPGIGSSTATDTSTVEMTSQSAEPTITTEPTTIRFAGTVTINGHDYNVPVGDSVSLDYHKEAYEKDKEVSVQVNARCTVTVTTIKREWNGYYWDFPRRSFDDKEFGNPEKTTVKIDKFTLPAYTGINIVKGDCEMAPVKGDD